MWAFAKQYYNKHVQSLPSSKNKVSELWQEAMSKFTPKMWENSTNHVEKLVRKDWELYMGTTSVANIPPIIIQLGDSDSDSDTEFESTSDSELDL